MSGITSLFPGPPVADNVIRAIEDYSSYAFVKHIAANVLADSLDDKLVARLADDLPEYSGPRPVVVEVRKGADRRIALS